MYMKFNQSGQDMSLPVVIQLGETKKSYFQIHIFGTLSLIVNVPFCHKDGGVRLCKLDILNVVS